MKSVEPVSYIALRSRVISVHPTYHANFEGLNPKNKKVREVAFITWFALLLIGGAKTFLHPSGGGRSIFLHPSGGDECICLTTGHGIYKCKHIINANSLSFEPRNSLE